MITFSIEGKDIRIFQQGTSPLVYLDHAPLMEVAEHHQEEFVAPLLRRGGTLAISSASLAEFTKVGSDETAEAVESLLVRVCPGNIVFLEMEAVKVIERENRLLAGGPQAPPHLDIELLEGFFRQNKPGSLNPIDCKGLIHSLRRSPEAAAEIRMQTVPEAVDAIRRAGERYQQDPKARTAVNTPLKGPQIQHPTRYVFWEALRYLARNGATLATPNDVYDFFHTVIPLSYCDYVVLDKKWWDAARQIHDRLRAANLLTHEAQVFKVGQLPEFLKALSSDK